MQVDLDLAKALFGQLDHATRRGSGIVRDSYGAGEQAAHDIMREAAITLGLETSVDAIGNLLARHFPANLGQPAQSHNQLPDRPTLL